MSEQIEQQAILKALHDETARIGGYVTGFIGLATLINGDGDRAYILMADPDQSVPTALGLVDMIGKVVDAQAREVLGIGGE